MKLDSIRKEIAKKITQHDALVNEYKAKADRYRRQKKRLQLLLTLKTLRDM